MLGGGQQKMPALHVEHGVTGRGPVGFGLHGVYGSGHRPWDFGVKTQPAVKPQLLWGRLQVGCETLERVRVTLVAWSVGFVGLVCFSSIQAFFIASLVCGLGSSFRSCLFLGSVGYSETFVSAWALS